ncbi:Six-hairpin glycosidase [Xylariomycetidae sp. FL0641]|nr:Six-hairpin glycosidase [Xylariomycetidae sp. FL0641]
MHIHHGIATHAVLLLGAWLARPACASSAAATPAASQPNSTRMARSMMARGDGIMTASGGVSAALQAGFLQKAFTALAAQYADDDIRGYVRTSAAAAAPFLANATCDALGYPLDRLANGNALLALASAGGNDTNALGAAAAALALRRSIDLTRRTPEGGLWYYVYPQWSYLDGMYSLAPFYTAWATASANRSNTTAAALDDVLRQLELLWRHCRHAATGLLVHGYDAARAAAWADPRTGASPHVWGRSLGWYAMAVVDTAEALAAAAGTGTGTAYSHRERVLGRWRALAPALLGAVDARSGAWWQVLDRPGRAGNYIESSASAMFAYALLKAARLGFFRDEEELAAEARRVGVRAHAYLTRTFVVEEPDGSLAYNGTVSVCSLNSSATYEYYVNQPILYNSVLGSAAYVFASLEVERLNL